MKRYALNLRIKHDSRKETIELIDDEYNPVAKMVWYPGELDRKAAEQIIRAVNAHEELLDVARMVVARGHTRPDDCYDDEYMGLCVCGHDKAKQAIAKAEGRP